MRAAKDDLATFARLVGFPLTTWQAAGLSLRTLFTVLVGARQVGKSRSLAVLAVWWAFRKPDQMVLVVSAGEEASKRLLGQVREVLRHPLLTGGVLDEMAGLVTLGNGSTIRSVPASERAVRGWAVDLLIVDEAAYVSDDLLEGAALPTITAREQSGARVVLASTPWEASGLFFTYAMMGEGGTDDQVATYRWRVSDCPWVSPALVARMRATMSALRFRSEYEGEFVSGGAGYFGRDDLLAAVVDYPLVHPNRARGGTVVLGADWGNRIDSHAVTLLGCLDDFGMNGLPVMYLPWLETSQARYREQVNHVAAIAKARPRSPLRRLVTVHESGKTVFMPGSDQGYDVAQVMSETNGVGGPATEALEDALGRYGRLTRVNTTQETKERSFGRVLDLLSAGQPLLPDHPQLLRELAGLEMTPTPNGGLRIAAAGTGHDDLAMSLSFAVLAVDSDLTFGRTSNPNNLTDQDGWLMAPNGLMVPVDPRPRWGGMGRERSRLYAN